ncbi:MAG TPA: hypothetical protein VNE86_01455 [Nitrososphaerales archaeon]|nr:hypothetical protein [Nitrososphaerales archaeon]
MSSFKATSSELDSSPEQIEQLVSKSSASEKLILLVFPDSHRCFRNFAAVSTIVELSKN